MPETTGTPKPKAAAKPKPAAASATSDEALLAQQAQEEREAKTAAAEKAERERVDTLPDAADGEHNGSIIDAVLEATRAAKIQMLQKLYEARHGEGGGVPEDDALLALEEELLTPVPVPTVPDGLELEDGPPAWVVALLAGQAQQTNAMIETLAEKLAGQTGQQINVGLSGDLETLVRQLEGTVSDGGDGDEPLAEPVTFMSKGHALKVIKKPRYRGVGHNGEQFFTTGIAADFAPTGTFTTRNREMVDYLRERPGFNREYWELGKEPFSAPNPKLIMEKVLDATLTLDDAALATLEQEEAASHKRPFVLDAIKSARTRVQGFNSGTE